MREIKFRYWDGKHFQYYGWVEEFGRHYFTGIPVGLGASLDDIFKGTEQYTGLRDKNGVEIYEGDVLHYDEKEYAYNNPVFWNESLAGFFVGTEGDCSALGYETWGVVIGNIHETPELIGGK